MISIHALLAESDETLIILPKQLDNFYPRSPCGERHRYGRPIDVQLVFLSTLSLRRATPSNTRRLTNKIISIHALLAESDPRKNLVNGIRLVFLSTLSLRRATYHQILLQHSASYFYPRSPCGERPNSHGERQGQHDFYPRSPCGERLGTVLKLQCILDFYPRSPCGERRNTHNFDGKV